MTASAWPPTARHIPQLLQRQSSFCRVVFSHPKLGGSRFHRRLWQGLIEQSFTPSFRRDMALVNLEEFVTKDDLELGLVCRPQLTLTHAVISTPVDLHTILK